MPKKRGKPNRRRLAALKGWRTRRREQEKRHRAALKGWRTRRRKKGGGGIIRRKKLRQFLFTVKYKQEGRKFIRLDFLVNAESEAEARKMVQKQMKLSRSGLSKWRVKISENLEAHPRKKSIELN